MFPSEVIEQIHCQEQHEELLFFSGELSISALTAIVNKADSDLSKRPLTQGIHKMILHILVECLQNVFKHAPCIDGQRNAICAIYQTNSNVELKVGNRISFDKMEELTNRIDDLNKMDEPTLRETYRKKLTESFTTNEQTFGLGLIDIVRKSGKRLNYQMISSINNSYFFVLHIQLPLAL
jgi:hypothetical protein